MGFKVGDRVRVIDNGEEDCFGLVGTIENTAMDFMDRLYYKVDIGKELPYVFFENQLELYEEKKEIEETKKLITLDELLERIEKLEKHASMGKYATDRKENVSNFEKTTQKSNLLTEDERVILRNLDKKWKWIGRDEVGDLKIFKDKPYREKGYCRSLENYEFLDIFNHLFYFIGLKDDEPYNIEELLKE